MSAVLHSGLHDATATDAKGRTTRHRAGDNPAGCRLAKLIANLGIRRPTPHYPYSDYGPLGIALFVLLVGILALAGLVLLLGAALVGVVVAGVLIGGRIFSSLSRHPFRR